VQSSAFLDQALTSDAPEVWTEMNYAVPASKIRAHIASVAANTSTPAATKAVLEAIIQPPSPTSAARR
jgi:hypothetical protein